MLTTQVPQKQKTLKPKQLLFVLNPQKYVEHEEALNYLKDIPHGMGVHTIVEAINFYAQAQAQQGKDAPGVVAGPSDVDARLKAIEKQLKDMGK